MSIIADKQEVLFDDNEETNNVQLKEEISQQMNLKLEDLNIFLLDGIRKKT